LDFYVTPENVPIGASRLPRSRVTLKSAEKINLDKGCVKLFTSAADSAFLPKCLRYLEGFDAKLRPWGLAELFRLLVTRRVRVLHCRRGPLIVARYSSCVPFGGPTSACA
jgi:hypothetical protein